MMKMVFTVALLLLVFGNDVVVRADDCVDLVNNVVQVENLNSSNPILILNETFATYDSDGNASCYNSLPNLYFPGQVQLLGGIINVTTALQLVNNSVALLSLEKNSTYIGVVCDSGVSKVSYMSDANCTFDFCSANYDFCKVIENVGVYNISDLQANGLINTTSILPDLPDSVPNSFVKGKWHFKIELQVGGNQTAFKIGIPLSDDWLYTEE